MYKHLIHRQTDPFHVIITTSISVLILSLQVYVTFFSEGSFRRTLNRPPARSPREKVLSVKLLQTISPARRIVMQREIELFIRESVLLCEGIVQLIGQRL